MKLKTLISIFLISTSILYAEESKNKPTTFEYGLKAQNFTYFPYETTKSFGYNKSELKNNKELVYLPFFKYRNTNKKFGFDFDMVDIKTYDLYYKAYYFYNGFFPTTYGFGNVQRQEYRFNFFYLPFENQVFYFGLGILKIDRFYKVENYEYASNINSDKINSYGISVPIRSKIEIVDGLELNLGFDPYVTYGRRNYTNQRVSNSVYHENTYGPYFYLVKSNPNNITEILGFQAEISLSYKFYDNLRFYVGFSRNQSIVRSINMDQTTYTYYGATNQLYVYGENKYTRMVDTHNSIYFGVSNTH
ncbi:hypothetical protein [Leptospira kanakyensis]|uniref:Porin n=1 Tax=Leptospira kanakyensis TaxID=2484968 RepID=A0A6N4Q970_9LEPT|nr:hypothetical protein [Leptospira kanakyensis]MCW7479652.1 hypothetical protein [Leptospira kanakyensis]TGK49896.1 hypothetical protein EHQ11_09165 [Leptospira kanakyensis]TGK58587.1 hypothetical protein EHQ16_13455 [Leptospira kanakyensis]TGK69034.1 hypothetical protein EHQ18_09325 [Leptospira kanakyensis]